MDIYHGDVAIDDRGILKFVNDFSFPEIKRFYIVKNYDNYFVRGWHGHKQETKYALVLRGSATFLIKPMDDEEAEIQKVTLDSIRPDILRIPPGTYHALRTGKAVTEVLFFSTATLKESKADDYRQQFTHNDQQDFEVLVR